MPLPFNGTNRVTSGFMLADRPTHMGLDIVGKATAALPTDKIRVYCVEAGEVIQSRMVTDRSDMTWQWGNYVCVQTQNGERHYYCHLDSRAVITGQQLQVGDFIGVMGDTGYSFGAHLHFERRNAAGKAINPAPVLGIPNQKGIYTQNTVPSGQQEETEMAKIKILKALKQPVSSQMLREGVLAIKGADGVLRGYNLKGEARLAREITADTLSRSFEEVSSEMQQDEVICITP